MRGSLRLVALLLLVPFQAGMLVMGAVELTGMHAKEAGRCPSHGPAVPSPTPASFQCCTLGHHWAMPGKMFPVNPTAMLFAEAVVQFSSNIDFQSQGFASIFQSASPPESAPLRI